MFENKEKLLLEYPDIIKSDVFIGKFLRSEVLYENGEYSKIIKEIIPLLDNMAKRTGSLWEYSLTGGSCNHGFTSFAIKWILAEYCGIIDIDYPNKTILLAKKIKKSDLELSFTKGKLKIKNGKIISLPQDFKVKYYD